ncbi:hypothetical protein BJ684DRAFT_20537 [Piptocephalis cylindrospora]|uniref:SsDNA binding protein n=1 Tax=Piptocephalis cylindrospora TaxID=1907219 RepID=A0A4P9Y2N1_9FUNG|nr:hypothetical protein BJ684DRAFT_20537 [Piptocephalis cylindrospora]|eukprot:RKP12944.1 hypothetical protein BJ684DRAFT_20537 [Piptocephalis cylindrospora]
MSFLSASYLLARSTLSRSTIKSSRAFSTTVTSKSYNRVTLVGRVSGSFREKSFPKEGQEGNPEEAFGIVSFSLATDRNFKDADGQWQRTTDWHRVVKKGVGVADYLPRQLAKGNMLLVDGKIHYNQFTDAEGQEKSITEIIAQQVKVLAKAHPEEGEGDGDGY